MKPLSIKRMVSFFNPLKPNDPNQKPAGGPPGQPQKPRFNIVRFLIYMLLFMVLMQFMQFGRAGKEVTMTQFKIAIAEHQREVQGIALQQDGETWKVTLYFNKNEKGEQYQPVFAYFSEAQKEKLVEELMSKGLEVKMKPPSKLGGWMMAFLPMLLFIGLLYFIFFRKGAGIGGGGAMNFGKSKARMATKAYANKTFEDVAGIDEVRKEVEEVVDFIKNPQKFLDVGAQIPKGILVTGPPGCGKTLLARALAGEAGVPFLLISGSDFVEMFVGVGAARVRDLFAQAKKNAPCIIFIDELDAMGRQRGAGLGGGHDEREQTLNQILVEIDGFESGKGIMIIAATNRPDILDPALIRPGRFDRNIVIDLPDVKGREAIFNVHTKGRPLAKDVLLEDLAQSCPGYSGAHIENWVNEAALLAARRGGKEITKQDFYEAQDKQILGIARKKVLGKETKKKIAYHESGHTLVASLIKGADPVEKVSIIPRGQALGVTWQKPLDDDQFLIMSQTDILERIMVLLGGRAAEKIIYKEVSTGAGNDLIRATELAEKMVCMWGMSEELGPRTLGRREGEIFLGRELTTSKNYSDKTAQEIDAAIYKIVTECEQKAEKLINDNLGKLNAIEEALLKEETLDGKKIKALLKGKH